MYGMLSLQKLTVIVTTIPEYFLKNCHQRTVVTDSFVHCEKIVTQKLCVLDAVFRLISSCCGVKGIKQTLILRILFACMQ